ncbi:MAG TPA: hypothetical protein VFQ30_01490 [Ktedonobacteraceae bacterium]|nr:hypothetical protein [Ktedonobacteraceae bacterium]
MAGWNEYFSLFSTILTFITTGCGVAVGDGVGLGVGVGGVVAVGAAVLPVEVEPPQAAKNTVAASISDNTIQNDRRREA